MDKKLKSRWLRALRSGKYKQAKRVLRRDETHYCCLGVLCTIVDRKKWEPKSWRGNGWSYEGAEEFPTDEFLRSVGLDLSLAETLAHMNDGGKRFSTIANVIAQEA
jgi:hypothetical protein